MPEGWCQLFVLCTILFYNSKISICNESTSLFGEITSVQGQGRLAHKGQAFKGPIGPASNRFNDEDYKDPLGSNKPGPSEAPTGPFKAPTGPFKAFAGPLQALLA